MKILFLIPYPLKEAPSQRFRFEQYMNLLKEKGIGFDFQSFWDVSAWSVLYRPGHTLRKFVGFLRGVCRRFAVLFRMTRYDFVFIHRECMPVGPPIVEWIVARVLLKKIIYDFDDAIWLSNTSTENRFASWLKWHGKVRSICRWSHRVSCGNAFLAKFAKAYNRNVTINPSTIDTVNLHRPLRVTKKNTEPVTVGWTGSHSTLKYLDSLTPVFDALEKKFHGRWRLLVIADRPPERRLPCLEFRPWLKETEIEDLTRIDIGIMPLPDDDWARGKCGFKALQYMALEIPSVISPVGVNLQIVEEGVTGYLCGDALHWVDRLSQLIENADLRNEMGVAARERVMARYSVLSNSACFLSLFD